MIKLGNKVRDKVSGLEGIVTGRCPFRFVGHGFLTKRALKRLGTCIRVAHSHGVMVMGKDESRAALATLAALAGERDTLRIDLAHVTERAKSLEAEVGRGTERNKYKHRMMRYWEARAEKAEAEFARLERRYAELVEMTATRTDQAKGEKA